MAVEVTPDEVVDLGLGHGVQVLELVHGGELDDVETVGKDTVGFPLEQVLAFVGGDVADGGENVRAVRRSPFDAVSVVDTALSSFMVDVKVLQVVVKIDRTGAKVPAEQRRVGGKDRGDVDMALPAEGDGQPSLPLVEVRDNGGLQVLSDVFAEEPRDEVAKDDGFVGFVVVWWGWDASQVPQVALPLVQSVVFAARVEKEDFGCTFDQPAAVEDLDALVAHALDGADHGRVRRLARFDFHGSGLVGERADESVSVAIFRYRDWNLGFDDSVNTADCAGKGKKKKDARRAWCGSV